MTRQPVPNATALYYTPAIDMRGRPKTSEVLVNFFTSKLMKQELVKLARARRVSLSELIRRELNDLLVTANQP